MFSIQVEFMITETTSGAECGHGTLSAQIKTLSALDATDAIAEALPPINTTAYTIVVTSLHIERMR